MMYMPFLSLNNEWFLVSELMTALQTTYAANLESGNTIAVVQALNTEVNTKIMGYKDKFKQYSDVLRKRTIIQIAIYTTFVVSFI